MNLVFRVLPPAASPSTLADLFNGLAGIFNSVKTRNNFHSTLSSAFRMKHCFSFSSGKAALAAALHALKAKTPGRSGVVIPAFNCWSVPSAIVNAGCTVIPCETDPETLDFDLDSLQKILCGNDSILAVCPTHLFGLPARTEQVRMLVKGTPVAVIEDAAQAMGTALAGNPNLCTGDIVIFSLGRGKAVSAGEGGVLLTNNDLLAGTLNEFTRPLPGYSCIQFAKLLVMTLAMYAFIHPRLFLLPSRLPFLRLGETVFDPEFDIRLLSGFQAGLARRWKQRLDSFNAHRLRCARYYTEKLSTIRNIRLFPAAEEKIRCIRFPVLFESEAVARTVLEEGKKRGLGMSVTYPDAVDRIPRHDFRTGISCDKAQAITRCMVTLPCHHFVSEQDMMEMVVIISSVLKTGA